jgi:hypothetical protein
MKRFTLALVFAGLLTFPAVAAAKGPDQASISGPSLDKTITLAGSGESMGTALGNLTQFAGFFPAAYGQSPDPMLKSAPTGDLGQRFRIHYRVPGENRTMYSINQDVYPYAHGGALTYMKPGQSIFGMSTRGGWFLGGLPLKLLLVHQGLSAKASSAGGSNTALVAGIAVPGGIALIAAAIFAAGYRRRSRPA